MVSVAQKIWYCFLFSAIVFAGIAILVFTGVFDAAVFNTQRPVNIFILASFFLTLFLTIFFCLNLRPDFLSEDQKSVDYPGELRAIDEIVVKKSAFEYVPKLPIHEELEELEAVEELEEIEAVEDAPERKIIPVKPSRRISNVRIAFGDDDVPYLVESSGLELVDGDIDEVIRFMEDDAPEEPVTLEELEALEELEVVSPFSSMMPLLNDNSESNDDAAELENISAGFDGGISMFSLPFAFSPGNPKLLQGDGQETLYEKNGIHYISNDVFNIDKDMEQSLNNDFVKLVESVVKKM